MKRRRGALQLEARRLKNMRAQGAPKVVHPKNYHTGRHPLGKIKSGNIQNYQTFIKHGMSSMIRSIR